MGKKFIFHSGPPLRDAGLIHTLFAEQARNRPDTVAVVSADGCLTYQDLSRRAGRLAGALRALGVGPESIVGICFERSCAAIAALLGVLEAGGAYLPLDPLQPEAHLARQLAAAGVRVLVTERRHHARLSPLAAVTLDLAEAGTSADHAPGAEPHAAVSARNPAYVLFTSGSTGAPKGVVVEHRSLVHYTRAILRRLSAGGSVRGLRFATVSTLAADLGNTAIFPSLLGGGTLHILSAEEATDPALFAARNRRVPLDVLKIVPSHLQALLTSTEGADALPARWLILGGEPFPVRLFDEIRRRGAPCRVLNHYGPTETTVGVSVFAPEGAPPGPTVPIGQALGEVRLRVLDADLHPVPPGAEGELYVGGVALARGYAGRPEATAERFGPDPLGAPGERLYRTGDIVRLLPGGDLEFRGRSDQQIKLRGHRIEPREVEAALERHPGVRQALVIAREREGLGPRLIAYFVAVGEAPAPAGLRAHLAGLLPSFMLPADFVPLAAFPRNANGKLDLSRLPPPPLTAPDAEDGADPDDLPGRVRQVFREVLGLAAVSLEDSLFALGGHSLTAVRLISRLRETLGVEPPLRAVFEASSPRALARWIESAAGCAAESSLPRPSRRPGPLPLSSAQQRFWLLDRLRPGDPTCHVPVALRLGGALSPAALHRALAEIVGRHEVLRTVYRAEAGGEPGQIVLGEGAPDLPVLDLGGLPDPAPVLAALAAAEAARPFDLTAEPPLRALLVRSGDGVHTLLLTFHHIAFDGWSLDVLATELGTFHEAIAVGLPSPFAPLALQYVDHCRWEREWLESAERDRQSSFWKAALSPPPPALDLAPGTPRRTRRRAAGRCAMPLPASLWDGLAGLGREAGTTRFTVLLAGLALLLQRAACEDDLCIAVPVVGRGRPGLDRLIGCFINTLALRFDLAGAPTCRELLGRARQTALSAYAHAELPFEEVVRELRDAGEPGAFPWLQAMLALDDYRPFHRGGLDMERLLVEHRSPMLTLNFDIAELSDGALAVLHHDRDLVDDTTARRLLGCWRNLLAATVRAPDLRISELDPLDEAERHQILREWNATAAGRPPGLLLHSRFEEQARRTPERIALVAPERELTYGELERWSARLAERLRRAGAGPEVRVGLCAGRSPELIAGMLAILRAGGTYVPLDPSSPPERLAHVLADAGLSLLLAAEPLPEGLATGTRIVPLAPAELAGDAGPGGELPAGGPPPDALAYVLYTSGTTGLPKGVMVSHRAIANHLLWMQDFAPLGPDDAVLQHTSTGFDVSVWECCGALAAGARLVLAPAGAERDPAALARTLAAHRVTLLQVVPPVLRLLLAESGFAACASLRWVFCGGEALPAGLREELARRLPEARLVNVYGPTEGAIDAVASPVEPGEGPPPLGRPIANVRACVVDRWLRPQPPGLAGELAIAGRGLARGYLGQPGLTAGRFVPDLFSECPGGRLYLTGDLARLGPDGVIEILGRTDHQIKLRGVRIEPMEIEAALRACAGVRDAAVALREEAPGTPRLVAYLVPDGTAPLQPGSLRGALRERLPEAMLPSVFVALTALPLDPHGKTDRRALPRPAEAPGRLGEPSAAPAAGLERELARVWARVLGVEQVGAEQSFFDLGGHSLLVPRLQAELRRDLALDVPLLDLYACPTVAALARRLRPAPRPESLPHGTRETGPYGGRREPVAVVGMACRMPGAEDVEELWELLISGRESVTFSSRGELLAAGVAPERLDHPAFVPASAVLREADGFDTAFFGYLPREAQLTDPQQRLFLECAWSALESSGHAGAAAGRAGVFAGASHSTYRDLVRETLADLDGSERMLLDVGSEPDYLASRVSYKLDLQGPSLTVQTACSTSLVAVHLACQSLRAGECDLALAGGVAVRWPQPRGHVHEQGGIYSSDGHCRPFDARADGTVSGDGVGVVVLRRLSDALADGDTIHAVLLGSAVGNDGGGRLGFTAPGAAGQAGTIRAALEAAGCDPATISLIEGHGTGTPVGDPIEVAGLTLAYGSPGDRRRACALGSIKGNLGHLDAAAGVAGLLKAVLALERRRIPPTLHFERPNPALRLDETPFFINAEPLGWTRGDGGPRRAAVSSLGLGGTNAHVILEEAPEPAPAAPPRAAEILLLSAKSAEALAEQAADLARHLRNHPELSLADVAFTLQAGRRRFRHRGALACQSLEDAAGRLAAGQLLEREAAGAEPPPVAFLFPGGGTQHAGMGRELYAAEPIFRAFVDRCAALLEPRLGLDLRAVMHAEDDPRLAAAPVSFAAIVVTELALAELLGHWGLRPEAMFGHSLGEYAAAVVAGVLELDDALDLVVLRGRLLGALPAGGMVSVPLPESALASLLPPGLSIAAINGPADHVVSGEAAVIDRFCAELAARRVEHHRLHLSVAAHSPQLDPILPAFRERVAAVRLRRPRIPVLSSLTGRPVTPEEAVDPGYWTRQLRHPVRCGDSVQHLLAQGMVLLEVGPGRSLTSLVRAQAPPGRPAPAWNTLRHSQAPETDSFTLASAVARLWLEGVELDWPRLHGGPRRRVPLPGHPLRRERCRIEPPSRPAPEPAAAAGEPWFYAPSWRRVPPPPSGDGPAAADWLLLGGRELAGEMARELSARGLRAWLAEEGETFERTGERHFRLRSHDPEDPARLLAELAAAGAAPGCIVDLRPLDLDPAGLDPYFALLSLARAVRPGVSLTVAGEGIFDVRGDDPVTPELALLLGPCLVLPQERPGVRTLCLDLTGVRREVGGPALARLIVREIASGAPERKIAYRGRHRWLPSFEPVSLDRSAEVRPLRERGVYLITGGLGRLGLWLARFLAATHRARLILVGRSPFVPRERWRELAAGAGDPELRARLQSLLEIEAAGGEVRVEPADVADQEAMSAVFERAERAFGRIDGVLHAAGEIRSAASFLPLDEMDAELARRASLEQLRAKVEGTRVLGELLAHRDFDICLLFSSNASVLGGIGLMPYTAANAFLDAFAQSRARLGDSRWVSASWDGWRLPGEEGRAAHSSLDRFALQPEESREAFRRIVTRFEGPHVSVSKGDLRERLRLWAEGEPGSGAPTAPAAAPAGEPAPRCAPPAAGEAPEPRSPVEKEILAIWKALTGIDSIRVRDNLFDIGGHSLLAMRIRSRIADAFGVSLTLRELFEGPTVAEMAALVAGRLARSAPDQEPPGHAPAPAGPQDIFTLLDCLEAEG